MADPVVQEVPGSTHGEDNSGFFFFLFHLRFPRCLLLEELPSVVDVVILREKHPKRTPCVNPRWRPHLRATLVPPSLHGLSHPIHLSRLAILQRHVFSLKTRGFAHLTLSYGLFSDGACALSHKGTEIRSHKDETFGEHKNPTVSFCHSSSLSSRCLHQEKEEALRRQCCGLVDSNQDLSK